MKMKKSIPILAILLIIGGLFYLNIFSFDLAKHHKEFNSEEWKNWKESEFEFRLRWEMIGSLNKKHKLKGKYKNEIINLLGKPEPGWKKEFSYNLGLTGNGVNAGVLKILFDENDICLSSETIEH